ncbi:sterol desaturase family protein [soil metagenome]
MEGSLMLYWLVAYIALSMRYVIFAGLAYGVFYSWKRRAWLYKKIQQKYPEKKRVLYELRYSFSSLAIFATLAIGIRLATDAGLTKVYKDFGEYGWGYFIFSVVAFILIHDTYFYWTHRLMHHPKLFKHVHKVHHMSHNPTPWAAFSFHPIEALIEFGIIPVVVFLFPLHPIAIFIFAIYMVTLNVLGHLGFEVFPRGFTQHKLFGLHNTSTHHNMHHKYVNCNYGLYFNIWDRLMRTNHAKYNSTFEEVVGRPKPKEQLTALAQQEEGDVSLHGM